jgi:shikimate kinase
VLVDALGRHDPLVVAAAGGVVLDPANRRALADQRCFVVWLRADPHVLAERAARGDHRPLLDDDPIGRMQTMAADRNPLYAEVADAIVDLDDRTADVVADDVTRLLEVTA